MSMQLAGPAYAARSASARHLSLLPALLVLAAVLFNPLLAILNGNLMALSSAHVIAAEIALVAAAHVLAIANYKPQMTPWYLLTGILVLIALYRWLTLGEVDPKYLRDLLLIPTFVVLGMTFDQRNLTRVVVLLHIVVVAGLLFEALDTAGYSALFKVQDYYIATRGYDAERFWNQDLDLYVSATRPDSRLFSFLDLHRLSSIFLEPVYLGNYCIIIIAFVCARYGRLSVATRAFLIIGTLAALVSSDGRLAAGASALIVAVCLIARFLPRRSAVLYLPVVTILALAIVNIAGLQPGSDNWAGRLAHTVDLLGQFDLPEYLGISNEYLDKAVDSGLAYLITTQSILGVAILWAFIVFCSRHETTEQIRFLHAICLYLALTLMVSFAFLSIKTAALLWFIHGTLQAGTSASRRHDFAAPQGRRAFQS